MIGKIIGAGLAYNISKDIINMSIKPKKKKRRR